MSSEKKTCRLVSAISLILLVLTEVAMVFNVTGVPRLPAYLYSLVPTDMEITWLYFLHIVLQATYALNITHARGQTEILMFAFANSVRQYLHIIRASVEMEIKPRNYYINDQNERGITEGKSSEEVAIESFTELEKVVQKFNSVFRWPHAAHQGISIIFTSFIMYVGIRKRPETPAYVMPVFFCATVMVLYRTCAITYTMGRMNAAADKLFEVLAQRITGRSRWDRALWRRLLALRPVAIQSGKLYEVKKTTILSYFSVVVSYLVVVLQVKDK